MKKNSSSNSFVEYSLAKSSSCVDGPLEMLYILERKIFGVATGAPENLEYLDYGAVFGARHRVESLELKMERSFPKISGVRLLKI